MTKGLPMAYNRDLQEDRAALFDAMHTTIACVRVTAGCFESMVVHGGPDLTGDFALTTELADFLAAKGVPFREAHHVAGRLVKVCEARACSLADLTLADLQTEHKAFTAEAIEWLQPEVAVERRTSRGGTAWVEVERQVALLRAQ